MDDNTPIYSSGITKFYLRYLKRQYPFVDTDAILKNAGMTSYEVEDQGHWFTQKQADRFHNILVEKTGNPNISREVGRYSTSSKEIGAAKQYTLGLLSPAFMYLSTGKIFNHYTRGTDVTAKKLRANKIELVFTPKPGVNEKPYQCQNRTGTLESLARLFTWKYAKIDHPECYHKNDDRCRYIITWDKTAVIIWKRFRNYAVTLGTISAMILFFVLPLKLWTIVTSIFALFAIMSALISEHLEKKDLIKTIKTQGEMAEDHLIQLKIRYNNALLVQEIGQATSTMVETDTLATSITQAMAKRLDYDRGLIMLANKQKSRLIFTAGYGYSEEEENLLRQTEFHLDKPRAQGIFVKAFREHKPFLIDDMIEKSSTLSERSLELAKKMGVKSLICVPLVYEKKSLGILAVDNIKSKRTLTQSDMNLLMGVASQTAVSIINAMSFQKLQISEGKYRTILESIEDGYFEVDLAGNFTFFNESTCKILGKPTKSLDWKLVRKDKTECFVETMISLVRDKNGLPSGFRGIVRNITDRMRAEEERKRLVAQLHQAQKMEAIGTLAGGVAHDLNNVLSLDLPKDSPLKKPVLTIQRSGEKASAIVQDLLTLARRGVAISEVVNLNHIISDYLMSPEHQNMRASHPGVDIEDQLTPNLLNILGSPVHLSKTAMNIITNAAEAMPEGGKIRISTSNRYLDVPIRGYNDIEEGDYVTLMVSDNGIGISPEDIDRVFEPFYTKKVMGRSGTGLGMAVVWGTVKDHKGYIDIFTFQSPGKHWIWRRIKKQYSM
jgi:PAS domain-containing protein